MYPAIIRPVTAADNAAIAQVIRTTLEEYGAARPGTVYFDETTNRLSELFTLPGSIYYIAEQNGIVLGGAGIYPTEALPHATCELVKMYLTAPARGTGLGKQLISACINFAVTSGYTQIYLETMPELDRAIKLYEKTGFEQLTAPLGRSGHFGCGIWMLKSL